MNSGLVTHSITSQRIESVNDPNLNKALFTLYEKLIPYFVEIENIQENINQYKNNIEINNRKIRGLLSRIKKPVVILTVILIFLIYKVISKAEANGEYLYSRFIELFNCEYDANAEVVFYAFLSVGFPLLLGFGICFLISCVINKKLKKDNSKFESEIVLLEELINSKIEPITNVTCFVPKNYRNSKYLAFFVDAYANSKIDNLKEAVNLCDTAEYRQMSLELQKMQIEALKGIEFNQLMISSQLDSLKRSVWLSNAVF